MIIHEPTVRMEGAEVVVAARIEFESLPHPMPDDLVFRVPERFHGKLSARSDGFLTALFMLAMRYKEPIRVHGSVSPKLLSGLMECQRIFKSWWPQVYEVIDVDCDTLSAAPPDGRGDVITAFSGGVDSFYTLHSHLGKEDGGVTHGLFGHGFDIEIDNDEGYDAVRRAYEPMFEELGLKLIPVWTNFQRFGTRWNWGAYHGPAIIGTAHVLGAGTGTFYMPATHTYETLAPWGSDPRVDPLLSSESLTVIHDGADATRVAKTEALSSWPVTYDKLRVCLSQASLENCCTCFKCTRTMITLDACGALDRYTTFPHPLQHKHVRRARCHTPSDFFFPEELIQYLQTKGKRKYIRSIRWSIRVSRANVFVLRCLRFARSRWRRVVRRFRAT